uniref:Pentatricopeptide repeat-containing protein n=1 Tax=Oryza punctata TaxID=4537 RepID=A0A0E0LDH8_ORYPU
MGDSREEKQNSNKQTNKRVTRRIELGLAPAHTVVANSLLHLYSSCGLPGAALDLFRRIPDRSLVSWNTAVDALVGNGDHLAALDLFREMQRDTELAPDAYTELGGLNSFTA